MEAVILSVNPSYVALKERENHPSGKLLRKFKDNIDRPLAAILTLNTFAHTIGAAGVGVQAQKIWGEESLTIVSIILTLLILILSEIIPKTLGANYWKSLAPTTAKFLKVLIFIFYPLIIVSNWITAGMGKGKKSILSRDEFEVMADIGEREGIFRKGESQIIKNLMRFNSIKVEDIMTPRTVMLASHENISMQEFFNRLSDMHFSRIPIYDKNIDEVTGFVLKDEILEKIIHGKGEEKLKSIRRDMMTVDKKMNLPELFSKLMDRQEHIALVIGEYGNTIGIVSMEDVVETLLGLEIVDEFDNIEDLQELARENWKIRAKKLGFYPSDASSEENIKE